MIWKMSAANLNCSFVRLRFCEKKTKRTTYRFVAYVSAILAVIDVEFGPQGLDGDVGVSRVRGRITTGIIDDILDAAFRLALLHAIGANFIGT
jgi:hypothetical protein